VTRLSQEVNPGAATIYVEAGLDWTAGDRIGLAPTAMVHNDSDYAIITNYDSATGQVDLDRTLTAYHYGAAASTASLYNGIDVRGEVFLLSRNIRI
jgi:hypothetical protein